MPGYRDWKIYPLTGVNAGSLKIAKRLAQGHTRNGKAIFYAFNASRGRGSARVVQFNLRQIGIDVDIKLFDRVVQHDKVGTRGEAFDISLRLGGGLLSRPVRLRQHPPGRHEHPDDQQRQRVVLQRPVVQPADGGGSPDVRRP